MYTSIQSFEQAQILWYFDVTITFIPKNCIPISKCGVAVDKHFGQFCSSVGKCRIVLSTKAKAEAAAQGTYSRLFGNFTLLHKDYHQL